ncbi:MAG: ABC transporter permease [Candidatus Binatia bacterium]
MRIGTGSDVEAVGVYRSDMTRGSACYRLVRYRDCLWLLCSRSLKVRYRRSVLGFGWSLLYPLGTMMVLTAVFSRVFPAVEHYAVYVIVGVLVWGFFSLACVQAMDGLLGASGVMRKVFVPAVLFPLSMISANFVNLLLSLLVLPLVVLLSGAAPGFHPLLLLEALACLFAFTTGLGLMLAAANLFFNDVRYFFEGSLLLWFYATPVVYPVEVLPERYRALLVTNPFFWLLEMFRAPLLEGRAPESQVVAVSAVMSVGVLVVGWLVFGRLEKKFFLYL